MNEIMIFMAVSDLVLGMVWFCTCFVCTQTIELKYMLSMQALFVKPRFFKDIRCDMSIPQCKIRW